MINLAKRLSCFLLAFIPAQQLQAQCFICDTEVRLSPTLANCFLENVDAFIDAAQNDPALRAEVNLKVCGTGRGLDSFPTFDTAQSDNPQQTANARLVYFLDVSSIECIRSKLQDQIAISDFQIDLTAECD